LRAPGRAGIGRLPAPGRDALRRVLELLAAARAAPSAVRDPDEAWRVHVADSLTGLEVEALQAARRIADVGSGAGFPGIPLAVALPSAHVDLIEAASRKCDFMRQAIEVAGITNASVVCQRAETWAAKAPPDGGRESYDVVAARAVGRMATLAELASPLLVEGGVLVAWKGRRDPEEEAELRRGADRVAMAPLTIDWVGPYAGSRHRHLHVVRKDGPTPERLPRRPGMAKKRPFGSGPRLGAR
jgi:16S rRNA (guanine527-N7)-methyltransferase